MTLVDKELMGNNNPLKLLSLTFLYIHFLLRVLLTGEEIRWVFDDI